MVVDPRTPVIVGVGQFSLRSVAARIGADPARAVLEPLGGHGPQKVVTEFAGVIAAGKADAVLVVGSENGSTLRFWRQAAGRDKPDFTEHIGGQLEDRGYGFEQYIDEITVRHGMTGAPVQYGLLENARRARLGIGVADYREQMAELFAPFSKIAAKNPLFGVTGGAVGGRDRQRDRGQPDDLRSVPAAAGGPRSDQPGGGRPTRFRSRSAPARGARGQMGHSAMPRAWRPTIHAD